MKTIGLIGGMSWESTQTYYKLINEGVRDRLGGLHSAKIHMVSVDFHEIAEQQYSGRWDDMGVTLGDAAKTLEDSGADVVLICTNTMHKVYDAVQAAVNVPVLHIADATGDAIKPAGVKSVILLGTRYTMEMEFYKDRLAEKFGLTVLTPEKADRDEVHRIIYDELVQGKVLDASRDRLLEIIRSLQAQGGEGVIAGCTEIGLLVQQEQLDVPLFDTAVIHAHAAVEVSFQ
ncbi:aspartate/glutamate racemase family protein [bacterium]|nr:aspartate/glutamate racemase family protein [bacterium]